MTSKRIKNSVLLMFITVSSGIIISLLGMCKMRLFLVYYGTEFNALYQILYQLLGYLSIVDLGIAPIYTAQLYKAVSEEDQEKILSLYKGCLFCQKLVILLMFFLMLIIYIYIAIFQNNNILSKFHTIISFSFLALPVIAQKTLVANYAYCDALQEKHRYEGFYQAFEIIRICIDIVIIVRMNFVTYLFFDCSIEIAIIALMKLITNKSKNQVLNNKREKYIKKDISPLNNTVAITVNQLCDQGINNTDYQLASQYYSYSQISSLSIYKYVVNIIISFAIQILYSTKNAFGNFFSSEISDREKIVEAFNEFVIFASCFVGVMTFIGIESIIKLISMGSDLQYSITFLNKYILVLWMVIRIVNIPLKIYSEARGTFRELVKGKFVELLVSLLLMFICLKVYGLFGVFIASILSKIFIEGYNYCRAYSNSNYYWTYFKRITLMILVLTITEFVFTMILSQVNLKFNTFITWIVSMALLSVLCLFILIVFFYMLFKNFRSQSRAFVNSVLKKIRRNNK